MCVAGLPQSAVKRQTALSLTAILLVTHMASIYLLTRTLLFPLLLWLPVWRVGRERRREVRNRDHIIAGGLNLEE